MLDSARREQAEVIKESDRKARVKFDKELEFPGKNDAGRQKLDNTIIEVGKWMEVLQLDTMSLTQAIENRLQSEELIDEVMKHRRIEKVGSLYIKAEG